MVYQVIKMEKHIFTVSELVFSLKGLVEHKFSDVMVEGEISNFKLYPSGHMYFDLKDESSVLPSAMFKYVNRSLKFVPESGMKVIAKGNLSVYEKQGKYQLLIQDLEPSGKGALYLAFEQLKEKLKKEGFFDEARKRKIPAFPKKIGVVTSIKGAALQDILNIITRRFSGVEIFINPVQVQGEGAKEQIAQAINDFNCLGPDLKPDVLIVGRGGGSIEDLWAFNEEIVARAVANSEIPVISAVGHETDYTICDFVADLRAPTPSAAAELVVKDKFEIKHRIETLALRLNKVILSQIDNKKHSLKNLHDNLLIRHPQNTINLYQQDLDDLLMRLGTSVKHFWEMKKENLKILKGQLFALSPEAILERGYSITFIGSSKKIVRDAAEVKKDDMLEIKVQKGIIHTKVE